MANYIMDDIQKLFIQGMGISKIMFNGEKVWAEAEAVEDITWGEDVKNSLTPISNNLVGTKSFYNSDYLYIVGSYLSSKGYNTYSINRINMTDGTVEYKNLGLVYPYIAYNTNGDMDKTFYLYYSSSVPYIVPVSGSAASNNALTNAVKYTESGRSKLYNFSTKAILANGDYIYMILYKSTENYNHKFIIADKSGNVISSQEYTSSASNYLKTLAFSDVSLKRDRVNSGNIYALGLYTYSRSFYYQFTGITCYKLPSGNSISLDDNITIPVSETSLSISNQTGNVIIPDKTDFINNKFSFVFDSYDSTDKTNVSKMYRNIVTFDMSTKKGTVSRKSFSEIYSNHTAEEILAFDNAVNNSNLSQYFDGSYMYITLKNGKTYKYSLDMTSITEIIDLGTDHNSYSVEYIDDTKMIISTTTTLSSSQSINGVSFNSGDKVYSIETYTIS